MADGIVSNTFTQDVSRGTGTVMQHIQRDTDVNFPVTSDSERYSMNIALKVVIYECHRIR